jgi:uncharacterized protein (DUF58 family)
MRQPNPSSIDGVYTSLSSLISLSSASKQIDFGARMKAQSPKDGSYLSNKRGRGMEFAEVRPYQAGDDIRTIDWRVTARTQETYTKLFQEEKERPVYLVVDQRSTMYFGSRLQFKSHLASRLAGLLAWAGFHNGDSLGAVIFGDEDQSDLRPKRGKRATLQLLNTLCEFNSRLKPETFSHKDSQGLPSILKELRRIVRPGSAVFIISDFHDIDSSCERDLSVLSRHSDIELIHTYDPLEQRLPKHATLSVSDGASRLRVDTFDRRLREKYEQDWIKFTEYLQRAATSSRIRSQSVSTEKAAEAHLIALFAAKQSRRLR